VTVLDIPGDFTLEMNPAEVLALAERRFEHACQSGEVVVCPECHFTGYGRDGHPCDCFYARTTRDLREVFVGLTQVGVAMKGGRDFADLVLEEGLLRSARELEP